MAPDPALVWPWNAPRPALAGPDTESALVEPDKLASRAGFDYLTPSGTRRFIAHFDLCQADEPPDKAKQLRRRLAALPHSIRRYYAHKLEQLDARGKSEAEAWLFNSFARHMLPRYHAVNARYQPQQAFPAVLLPLRGEFFRLLWSGRKALKRLAHNLACTLEGEFTREFEWQLARSNDLHCAVLSGYGRVGFLASYLTHSVPGWQAYCAQKLHADPALNAVTRLQCARWWLGRLRRLLARWREHLMIATGYVQNQATPYCSAPCFEEWRAQKKANREFLNRMELEDQDTGERISLIDKVSASIANPAIRRCELMVRMRGFEEIAKQQGLAGEFFTLTAPSRYHATLTGGQPNPRYQGDSPRDTQHYLCKVWSKTRAAWTRCGIRVFGFRVVEPHHDATPHWHVLVFMPPQQVEAARTLFRHYALETDGAEPGATANRFTALTIEQEKGGATGYLAKYISKNIDGYALDDEQDHQTGEPLKAMASRVSAWASRWGIRQFQQIGGAPVTVYRELRRLRDRELVLHPHMSPAHGAADEGNWAGYTLAQGGPLVLRKALRVRLSYEVLDNAGAGGETMSKIAGVYSPLDGPDAVIFTRSARYTLVPKKMATKHSVTKHSVARQTDSVRPAAPVDVDVDVEVDVDVDVDFTGGHAAPWSSVNNCTPVSFSGLSRADKKTRIQRLSASRREEKNSGKEKHKCHAAHHSWRVPINDRVRAARLRDFAHSLGFWLSDTEIYLLLAGQSILLDKAFYCARSDGVLYRIPKKPACSIETQINTWLAQLGVQYRYRYPAKE